MSTDIIPAPVRRPTGGRTSSLANRVYAPQGKRINALIMSKRHGIISSDIIPVLICCPTGGRTISLANHAHPPEGKRINALIISERHGKTRNKKTVTA